MFTLLVSDSQSSLCLYMNFMSSYNIGKPRTLQYIYIYIYIYIYNILNLSTFHLYLLSIHIYIYIKLDMVILTAYIK